MVWKIDKFLKKNGLQKSTYDGNMYYHHQNYASSILEEFGITNYNPWKTSLPQNFKLCKDMNSPLIDLQFYQWMVGKLVFLTNIRWDIAYAMNLVLHFMTQSQLAHL